MNPEDEVVYHDQSLDNFDSFKASFYRCLKGEISDKKTLSNDELMKMYEGSRVAEIKKIKNWGRAYIHNWIYALLLEFLFSSFTGGKQKPFAKNLKLKNWRKVCCF